MICLLIYASSNYFHYLNDTGTNLCKQELFVMAIRTPTERTFPGNFTIIPLSKKWVFHSIFRHAFLSIYGKFICSLNRLVVTDEEGRVQIFWMLSRICHVPSMRFGNLLSMIYICCCHQNKHALGNLLNWLKLDRSGVSTKYSLMNTLY